MLIEDCLVNTEAPTAPGTTTVNSGAYDMAGFEEIAFIVRLGSPTNNSIKVQQDTAVAMGSAADLTGTLVQGTVNTLVVNLARPLEQFVRCVVTRGSTTTVDGITVIRTRARNLPVTQGTGTLWERWRSPAEGTA